MAECCHNCADYKDMTLVICCDCFNRICEERYIAEQKAEKWDDIEGNFIDLRDVHIVDSDY